MNNRNGDRYTESTSSKIMSLGQFKKRLETNVIKAAISGCRISSRSKYEKSERLAIARARRVPYARSSG